MKENKSEIFQKLLNNPDYRALLDKLPEGERETVMKTLSELVTAFEDRLISPLKNLKSK